MTENLNIQRRLTAEENGYYPISEECGGGEQWHPSKYSRGVSRLAQNGEAIRKVKMAIETYPLMAAMQSEGERRYRTSSLKAWRDPKCLCGEKI